jgi:hypothetical protein
VGGFPRTRRRSVHASRNLSRVSCADPGQNPSAVRFGSYRVRGRGLGMARSRRRGQVGNANQDQGGRVAIWVAVQRRAPSYTEGRASTLVQPEPIRTTAPRAANAVGSSAMLTAATSHHQSIGLSVTTDHGEVETPELGLTRNWLLAPHRWARRREGVPGAVTVKIVPSPPIMR